MGIKNFSKVFEHHGEIKIKDLRNKTVAVDAMYQLHRLAHPFKAAANATLTAPDGSMTNHINGLLALILNLKKAGAKQVWIFDNPGEGHDSLKDIEVERRRSCQQLAKKKLDDIVAKVELFSDSEDDADEETMKKKNELAINRNKYERAAFSLDIYMINDLKYMLDCFGVPWIEAPSGFEAEQFAAYITQQPHKGISADAVLTPDPDCLLFGAKQMIKNDKQKFYKYNLSQLLKDNKLDQDRLIKIGVILGCDFAEKTPGVGPKTVLKKYATIEMSERQLEAVEYFKKPICPNALAMTEWHTTESGPFGDLEKMQGLFQWMTVAKGFSISRTESRFKAAKIGII